MKFLVNYDLRSDWSEDKQARAFKLFTNWEPPAGVVFEQHYACTDGNGGAAIVEVDNSLSLAAATTAFEPYFVFKFTPIAPIEEVIPIILQQMEWRTSLLG